jgi:hypothetical protein
MLNSSIQISKPEDVINVANKWANEVFSRPKTKDYRAVKQMENEYDDALEALEKLMMALLEGEDDEDDEDCDEEGNLEDMEYYGMQLVILDDGERSFATDIDIAMALISSLLVNHPSMDVELYFTLPLVSYRTPIGLLGLLSDSDQTPRAPIRLRSDS